VIEIKRKVFYDYLTQVHTAQYTLFLEGGAGGCFLRKEARIFAFSS
jgi:hypothetical protein